MKYRKIERVLVNLFFFIIFCALFAACGTKSDTQNSYSDITPAKSAILNDVLDIKDYVASYPIKLIQQATEDEIARKLFDIWLEHFKEESVKEQIRLRDYEIHEVAIPPAFQNCINDSSDVLLIAEIIFSVQTFSNPSPDWTAGTGTIGENDWINDKLTYVSISEIDEMYSLQILGIPPCTDAQ